MECVRFSVLNFLFVYSIKTIVFNWLTAISEVTVGSKDTIGSEDTIGCEDTKNGFPELSMTFVRNRRLFTRCDRMTTRGSEKCAKQ